MFPAHIDALWARLADPNDLIAPADFAEAVIPPLLAALRSRHRRADSDLIFDAVHETLVGLMQHPERYDPRRGSLSAYLRRSAIMDLRNAVAHERRRSRRGREG